MARQTGNGRSVGPVRKTSSGAAVLDLPEHDEQETQGRDRLQEELLRVASALQQGRLAERARTELFTGSDQAVVESLNAMLESVIRPLKVSAEYVDRISKGDVPPKITDTYNGDFNEIKNSLNHCIDGLGGLAMTNTALTRMAVNDYSMRVEGAYAGVFGEVAHATNQVQDRLLHVVGVLKNVAKGDFSDLADLQATGLRSKHDDLRTSFVMVLESLGALVSDGEALTQAMLEGKLAVRADAAKHQGDFRKVIEGFNLTLDNVIKPLNVSAEYVDRISKGDIPPKITDTYNGDFNEIKNNLNVCIDALARLAGDGVGLTQAMLEGKLAVRSDATRHEGDFRKLIEGFNMALDNVIKPLNVSAEFMDRISKGDIPPKITDAYNGDFNEIKNNLNVCIDSIGRMVNDGIGLTQGMLEGKLAVRSDATKHQGDFRKVIEGFNLTLDNVIKPLNVSAEYVDRISKGDIPPKITDAYTGDFNEIKNNLNNCIDNINALVNDAAILAKAAVEGQLATRADAKKHQGDYRKIVEGVNETLDAVIGPLNVSAEYVDRISRATFRPKSPTRITAISTKSRTT